MAKRLKKNLVFLLTIVLILSSMGTAVLAEESDPSNEPTQQSEIGDPNGGTETEGTNPEGTNPEGTNPQGDDPEGANPQGDNTEGANPQGDDTEGTNPQGDDTEGVNPQGDDTEGTNPQGNDTEGSNPQGDDTEGVAQIDGTTYATLTEAIKAATDNDTIELLEDVNENITINKSLTLDLGGKTLTGKGAGSVVTIDGEKAIGGELNVTVKNGTITGGNAKQGAGVDIEGYFGNVTLDSCVIMGNHASNNGGGVNIAATGTVTIKGGKITGNTAYSGAGIRVMCGKDINKCKDLLCVLDGVGIENNTSDSTGGGVAATGQHPDKGMVTVEVEDGTSISNNTAKTSCGTVYGGGGVYITGSATKFIMNGGTISNNTAKSGAGINSQTRNGLKINGGSIIGNVASYDGGGIYVANSNPKNWKQPLEQYDTESRVADGVIISGNKAENNGGGLWIGTYLSAVVESGSQVYNNTANVAGDDIYFNGKNWDGFTSKITLPVATEMGGNLILSSDNTAITGWYHDGQKWNETSGKLEAADRWTNDPTDEYTPTENDTTPVALKAAHPKMCTLTYEVKGDIPEKYTTPDALTLVCNSKYTVADVPDNVSGTKDGKEGTFSFAGWTTEDGTAITGEQILTENTTLHGVWTFTANKSSGTDSGSTPVPTPTPKPDTTTPDEDVDIDDPDVPLDPTPDLDDGDVEIDDSDVPLDPTPDLNDGDAEIDDSDVPLDSTPDLADDETAADDDFGPQTGDNSAMTLLITLMILSGLGLVVLLLSGKNTKKFTK